MVRTMVSAKIMVYQALMEQTAERQIMLVPMVDCQWELPELMEAMVGATEQVILLELLWDTETVTVVLMDTDCHLEFRMESPMDKVPALVQVCRMATVSVITLAVVHRKATEPV